jgi:GTP-binding protein
MACNYAFLDSDVSLPASACTHGAHMSISLLCQVVYASGIQGIAGKDPAQLSTNLTPLFDEILRIPKAVVDPTQPLQLLVANVDYDDFKGKLGIGRIVNGVVKAGDDVLYGKPDSAPAKKGKIGELFVFNNVGREKVASARAGDIVVVSGIPDITIGDTIMSSATVSLYVCTLGFTAAPACTVVR